MPFSDEIFSFLSTFFGWPIQPSSQEGWGVRTGSGSGSNLYIGGAHHIDVRQP